MKVEWVKPSTAYEAVKQAVIEKLGYPNGSIAVEMDADGSDITELLLHKGGREYVWERTWWNGEQEVNILGAAPVSKLDLEAYWKFD